MFDKTNTTTTTTTSTTTAIEIEQSNKLSNNMWGYIYRL